MTLLSLFIPGFKIYLGMTSSASTRGIAWSTSDDLLTGLMLMAWVAVGCAVQHDRHHAREATRLDLQLDQIKSLSPSGLEAFFAELFRSQGY